MAKHKKSPSNPQCVDVHFHGAFGIDIMTASEPDLDRLAVRLKMAGVGAFCPTTLSASAKELRTTVARLGSWIRKEKPRNSALPAGIHLEGPFLARSCCGAHPPAAIRAFTRHEFESLWEESQGTLLLITLAPERLSRSDLRWLCRFASQRGIRLAIGHSEASEKEALAAFEEGFSGVTHLWNAMDFHHRNPGIWGALMKMQGLFIELICDQVHVNPEVLHLTYEALKRRHHLCWISDATPAAGLAPGKSSSFGPLRVTLRDGASRLKSGALAGGGLLLGEAMRALPEWAKPTARELGLRNPGLYIGLKLSS